MAQTEPKGSGATSAAATQTTPPATPADAARVAELEAENKRLREQLAAAGETPDAKARPHTPSFTFSASMVADLETTGRTVSPFDGTLYVGTGRDDAREATVDEFNKAKPPTRDADKADARPAAGRKR